MLRRGKQKGRWHKKGKVRLSIKEDRGAPKDAVIVRCRGLGRGRVPPEKCLAIFIKEQEELYWECKEKYVRERGKLGVWNEGGIMELVVN